MAGNNTGYFADMVFIVGISVALFNRHLPRYWFVHLLPFLLFISVVLYFQQTSPQDYQFEYAFLTISGSAAFLPRQYGIYFGLATFFYTLSLVWQTIKHDKAVKDNFSFDEKMNMAWLKNWSLFAVLFFMAASVIITASVESGFPPVSVTFQLIGFITTQYTFKELFPVDMGRAGSKRIFLSGRYARL